MQTYLSEELVHERVAELRGSGSMRPAGSRLSGRGLTGRERVGGMLVTLGLRMVGDGRHLSAHGKV